MGQSPSILQSSGAIGMLEFNTCCPQCGGGHFDECQLCGVCCPAIAYPHGPEWEAAAVGFAPLLAEAERIAGAQPTCCGCYDAMAVKTALDAGWTARANAYLAQYNLRAEVYYWITTDDKGNIEHHVAIQFFRGAAAPGKSLNSGGAEHSWALVHFFAIPQNCHRVHDLPYASCSFIFTRFHGSLLMQLLLWPLPPQATTPSRWLRRATRSNSRSSSWSATRSSSQGTPSLLNRRSVAIRSGNRWSFGC
jgi:hypothetical protein